MSLVGRDTPRLHTPLLGDLPSRGADFIGWSESVGFPLLPWQQWLAVEAHRVKADGRWAARTCGLTVARQNGKSGFMRMLVLWHMFELGTMRVLSMAQNRALALDQFRQAVDLVESVPELAARVKRVNRTNGSESLTLDNGAQWAIVAATMEGPRGRTADLLWVDELREISEPAWKAATPVTRARMNARTWVTSNAGDAHSTVLNDLRGQAIIATDPAVFWAEWSADPDRHPSDPVAWQQANPALGHLIDEDVIRQAQATDKPEAFMTETLCRWVDAIESPWPYGAWDACTDPQLVIRPDMPCWFGLDVSLDRRRADLVVAALLDDGRSGLGLLDAWTASDAVDEVQIASDVAELARQHLPQSIVFDKWTGQGIATKLQTAGFMVEDCSGVRFATACDSTLGAMVHGRLVHAGQEELTTAMNACARRNVADGGWRVVRRDSAGHISAAVALIMAVHAASQPASTATMIIV